MRTGNADDGLDAIEQRALGGVRRVIVSMRIEEQARVQKTTSVAELLRRSKGELTGVQAALAELRA